MSPNTLDDLGKLVLRLSLGVFLLMHGLSKLMNGISGIEGMVVAAGMPAFLAWAVYLGEVVAPILIILGIYTRLGGWLVVANMVVAIALAHSSQIFQLASSGAWQLEHQGLLLFGGLAIALLGAGRYAIGARGGRWN